MVKVIIHSSQTTNINDYQGNKETEENTLADTDLNAEICIKFLRNKGKYGDPERVIVTHKDTDPITEQIIINTAKKEQHTATYEYRIKIDFQESKKAKVQEEETFVYQKQNNVKQTASAVKKSKEMAVSKEQFIREMQKLGYMTNWIETRKHVTFINNKTKTRVRLARLEAWFDDKSFTKESLISDFERNYEEMELQKAIVKNIIKYT